MPGWRLLAAGIAVAAAALTSHWLMLHTSDRPWGSIALLAPLVAGLGAFALRRRHLGAAAGCVIAALALVEALTLGSADDLRRLYLMQHAGAHAALAVTFGASLRPGHTPVITRMGEFVHERFTPEMRAYTVRLTAIWTGYFVAVALLSVALYVWAPWAWWSLFANVLTPISAVALFVGDHFLRRWRHPEFERVDLRRSAAAWRHRHAAPSTRPQSPPPAG
jgi:uncharacterized membrane protein